MIRPIRAAQCLGLLLMVMVLAVGCSTVRTTPENQPAKPSLSPRDVDRKQSIPPAAPAIAEPRPLAAVRPQPPPRTAKYFVHTVRHTGETLVAIAAWYTGNGANWKRLTEANPGLDPKRIHIGDAIRIPEQLVATRRPMPKPSLPAATTTHKPPLQPKQPKPAPAVELFGPVDSSPAPDGGKDSGLPRPLQTIN
jgi:LysM domain